MTAYPKKNIKEIGLVDVQVEELEIWDEGIGAVGMIPLESNHHVYVNLMDTEKFTDKRNGNV